MTYGKLKYNVQRQESHPLLAVRTDETLKILLMCIRATVQSLRRVPADVRKERLEASLAVPPDA